MRNVGSLTIALRADPEFHAMLAEALVAQLVAVAAADAKNQIRHDFTRARLRLGIDRATPADVDVVHAECFRQAVRLQVIRPNAARSLLDMVQISREATHG